MKKKIDIYKMVTDEIIAALEAGVKPWEKSWSVDGCVALRHNGKPYRGINQLLLWMRGRDNPYWMTYRQAKEYGGQVRSGEKSSISTFFKMFKMKDKVTEEVIKIPLLKRSSVFNAEQIDDLPERFYPQEREIINLDQRDAEVEEFVARTRAEIKHGGSKAFFSPHQDFVQMPKFEKFEDGEAYYATLLHELGHWTGHENRLDRNLKNSYGSKDYAREELVAELAAAMMSAKLGVSAKPRADHASYLDGWLKVLKEDKRAIFRAASMAQRASDFLIDLVETNREEKKAA